MNCRFCNSSLNVEFANLGSSPLANSFIKSENFNLYEPFFPLEVFVCSKCFLVQLDEFENPSNIFSEYAYMSSFSNSWLNHIEEFVNTCIEKFDIKKDKQVIEIASNDGYLLQFFHKKDIKTLGIEPAQNVAKIAQEKNIETITKFFSVETANYLDSVGKKADLLIAFNVLPHVPNLIDFIKGLKIALNKNGIIVIQFSAYLKELIENVEFDVIYHEHFSYFSLFTLDKIFTKNDLEIFDVEENKVHGGSMRLFIKHKNNTKFPITERKIEKLKEEEKFGLTNISTYKKFQTDIITQKMKVWDFFIKSKSDNKIIVGYGAPAKGNTMLNYCGIGIDFLEYTVDKNPYKQGMFLPGSRIPILNPEKIKETKPDYLLILPWNLKNEIIEQMSFIRDWGGKFVVLTPHVEIF